MSYIILLIVIVSVQYNFDLILKILTSLRELCKLIHFISRLVQDACRFVMLERKNKRSTGVVINLFANLYNILVISSIHFELLHRVSISCINYFYFSQKESWNSSNGKQHRPICKTSSTEI